MNNLSDGKISEFRSYLPLNPDYHWIYNRIINSIKFYETSEIIAMVKQVILRFLQQNITTDKYCLLIDDKWGSEQWLMAEFGDLLYEYTIEANTAHLDFDQPTTILLLDDAIYSGINIWTSLECCLVIPEGKDKNVTVYILSALITYHGQYYIELNLKQKYPQITIKFMYYEKIPTVLETFRDFSKKDWDIFNDINYNIAYTEARKIDPTLVQRPNMQAIYKGPYFNSTTVFLGHKIANEYGTLNYLITLLIDRPINREPIEQSFNY